MTGPLPDTWYRRDFPMLIALAQRFDRDSSPIHPDELADLGIAKDDVQAALHALRRRGYIDANVMGTVAGAGPVIAVLDISGDAYTLTGMHPRGGDDLAALIDAFRQAAERTGDDDERSRLRKAADALRDASSDVAKLALATYLASRFPA